jgi:hypothetical protein
MKKTPVGLLSTNQGRILIDWPDGAPVRFTRNVAAIVKHHDAKRSSKADFSTSLLNRFRCRRADVRTITEKALSMNDRNFRAFIKRLGKELESPFLLKLSKTDLAICIMDEAGALAGCTKKEQSKRVSRWMKERIDPDAYRQRLKRLRDIPGTKFRSF